jgi:hypothetical protein
VYSWGVLHSIGSRVDSLLEPMIASSHPAVAVLRMKRTPPTAYSAGLVRQLRLLASAILTAVFMVACASVPSQEMSDARQAVFSARDARAATYAPRSMESAEQLLDNAERSLKQGQYDAARDDALEARQAAMKARQVAVAIAEARTAVEAAKSRGGAWASAERLVAEAQAAGQQGDESRAWELALEAKRLIE